MSAAQILAEGLDALRIALPAEAQDKLLAYARLLLKWNRVYNLTAVRDEEAAIRLHLLDSLAVLPFLDGTSLADVGSGGGLPGIPLAIARPDLDVTLIESNQKKSTFQKQAAIELGLSNVRALCSRVEQVSDDPPFQVVISRAFADLADFVAVAGHLVGTEGRLLAMKGIHPADEMARLPDGFHVKQCIPLMVPGINAQRHLIVIQRG